MRKKESQIPLEEALQVFDRCPYATLATSNADGTPYCIPLSIVRKDHFIYFHCAKEGQKVENLRSAPAVCISCVSGAQVIDEELSVAYRSAVLFGQAQEVTDPTEKALALQWICDRYLTAPPADVAQRIQKGLPATAIWKIRIDKMTGKQKCRKNAK